MSAESIVTMVVEPGVEAGAVDVRGHLLTESDLTAAFVPQHCPVADRSGTKLIVFPFEYGSVLAADAAFAGRKNDGH